MSIDGIGLFDLPIASDIAQFAAGPSYGNWALTTVAANKTDVCALPIGQLQYNNIGFTPISAWFELRIGFLRNTSAGGDNSIDGTIRFKELTSAKYIDVPFSSMFTVGPSDQGYDTKSIVFTNSDLYTTAPDNIMNILAEALNASSYISVEFQSWKAARNNMDINDVQVILHLIGK